MLGRDLPEALRNRLLRRVDWRFLLPSPLPRNVLSLARGTLARAVDLLGPQDPATAPDLAVAVAPDQAQLRLVFARLAPGGACYTEWGLRGPASVRRRLTAAGFEQISLYWPWPAPGSSSSWFWMPLESRAAPAFVLATRLPAANRLRRALDPPLRALWMAAHRAGWLRPVCAVARKPAGGGSPADDILGWIRRHWSKWDLGPTPEHLSWHLLTRGPRTISKAVGLVFAEPDPVPRVVLKRPRVPEATSGLEREAAALTAVQKLQMRGVPRLLSCGEHGGYPVLAETALSGRPLFSLLSRSSYRDLALRATDWLTDLLAHHTPRSSGGAAPLLDGVMDEFERSFGAVADDEMLRRARKSLADLRDLPSVVEQRDFSPWNVHVGPDGGLAIFDWESAELDGMPLLDLTYFLSYLAFFYDGATATAHCRDSYRRALDPSTFTGRVHQECVQRYATRLGLEQSLIHPLRLLTWMIHSRSDYRHLTADLAGPPSAAALRNSLFFGLWLEELRA